jgi:ABC-type transport system substrate-binding protein
MDKEIATAVAAQFQEVGVRATVQPVDLGTLVRGLTDSAFPIFLVGWQNTPNFDADTALQWFQTSSVYKWSGDAVTDDLILKARTAIDPAERKALYAQATLHMRTKSFPAVFLFQTKLLYGISSQVDGFVARPDEYYNFRTVRVR